MKILVIEDSPEFAGYLKDDLICRGHKITLKKDADDAIDEFCKIHQYDAVVLDLMLRLGSRMSHMEGEETGIALYIRIREMNPNIPILILSARDKSSVLLDQDTRLRYFEKPLTSINRQSFYTMLEDW